MKRIFSLSAIHGRMPFEKALCLSKHIITNAFADRLLEGPCFGEEQLLSRPFNTRTIIAFPSAGMAFKESLECHSYSSTYAIDTKDFAGERGIALAFDEFEFVKEGRWRTFIPNNRPGVIEGFPKESGWYGIEKRHCLSTILGVSRSLRFLSRPEAGRIIPVVRSFGMNGGMKHDISLTYRPNQHLDVLAEPIAQGEARSCNVIPK